MLIVHILCSTLMKVHPVIMPTSRHTIIFWAYLSHRKRLDSVELSQLYLRRQAVYCEDSVFPSPVTPLAKHNGLVLSMPLRTQFDQFSLSGQSGLTSLACLQSGQCPDHFLCLGLTTLANNTASMTPLHPTVGVVLQRAAECIQLQHYSGLNLLFVVLQLSLLCSNWGPQCSCHAASLMKTWFACSH